MTNRHTCLFFSSMIFLLSFKGLTNEYFLFLHSGSQVKVCWAQVSLGVKGEGEMARGVPIVWRSSFSRRRGRVARGKPLGFALPFTQGGWQGRRLVQPWLQETWLQVGVLLLVGREACRPALWVNRPGCRCPRRCPGLRRPWWPS